MQVERIGNATLYCADCLEVLPTLGKVDAVVTDPPYNFSTTSSGTKHHLWADAVNSSFWFCELYRQYLPLFKSQPALIWQFMNWRTFIPLQKAAWDCDLKFESVLVWDKQWIGPGGSNGLRPSYELVALICANGGRLSNRGLPDIWQHPVSSHKPSGHPAEKPLSLIREIVKHTTASTILDPFMGSGTTGVACVELGRNFIGIEIDSKYFDIACQRITQAYAQGDLFIDKPAPQQTEIDA